MDQFWRWQRNCQRSGCWDAEEASFGYDAGGNLTSQSGKLDDIAYEHRNLPVQFSLSSGDTVIANYNADGQRILKELKDGSWQFYVMDGQQTLAVIDNNGFSHFNLVGNNVFGRYTDSGARRYYITDHLGSTRAVVDNNGNVIETFDYYPFGLPMPKRYENQSNTLERFTGKERDEEGGLNLDYFGARYYDPVMGRWTSVDPMAETTSPNEYLYHSYSSYNYTLNNPFAYVDPNGLWVLTFQATSRFQVLGTLYGTVGVAFDGTNWGVFFSSGMGAGYGLGVTAGVEASFSPALSSIYEMAGAGFSLGLYGAYGLTGGLEINATSAIYEQKQILDRLASLGVTFTPGSAAGIGAGGYLEFGGTHMLLNVSNDEIINSLDKVKGTLMNYGLSKKETNIILDSIKKTQSGFASESKEKKEGFEFLIDDFHNAEEGTYVWDGNKWVKEED